MNLPVRIGCNLAYETTVPTPVSFAFLNRSAHGGFGNYETTVPTPVSFA